jgi:hypothetical protein
MTVEGGSVFPVAEIEEKCPKLGQTVEADPARPSPNITAML